ncbi:MAG: hypothetical protein K2I22_05590 [Lachnospiraceae bacterium]|nr:hypothetical protein [Lachnospiraceae bacterium]
MGILSGYKRFKKYLRTGDGYKLCSEWTNADSVEMADGTTLQESMDTVVGDVENTQNELKTSLGGMTFGVDAAGRYGYIKAGADTVTPFKDMNAMLSDVKFTLQTVRNTIWNSRGTAVVQASYKVPDDGVIKVICTGTYYRCANQGIDNGNKLWHTITINGNTVLNTQNGDAVVNTILTFDVAKDDIVAYNYCIKYTSGDAIYASITADLATLFAQK